VASAGTVRNIIPSSAQAMADVRVLNAEDWDLVEALVRERITKTRVPDTTVDVVVERRRPALVVTPSSRALANEAVRIYSELGRKLGLTLTGTGGGTDAALSQLGTRAPVIEGMGLTGFGAHSNDREYINISTIESRLYLATRLITGIGQGQIPVAPNR
jgi:glutamate carboxypeptidase